MIKVFMLFGLCSAASACLYDKQKHAFYCASTENRPPDSIHPGAEVIFCKDSVLKTKAGRPYCGKVPDSPVDFIMSHVKQQSEYVGQLQLENSRLMRLLSDCGCMDKLEEFGQWSKVKLGDRYIQGEFSTYGKVLPEKCKVGQRFSLQKDELEFTLYECLSAPNGNGQIKAEDVQQPKQ